MHQTSDSNESSSDSDENTNNANNQATETESSPATVQRAAVSSPREVEEDV